ncbi:MAG: C39 family peptidase [Chthonomonas sp.]|nr:C39 family peptidase [Chthonomonas sp.]
MKATTLGFLLGLANLAAAQEFAVLTAQDFTREGQDWVSRPMPVPAGTQEIVPSWRLFTPWARPVTIALEVQQEQQWFRFDMARWASAGSANTSFARQEQQAGKVFTDTLSLNGAAAQVRVRIAGETQLDEFYLSFAPKLSADLDSADPSAAWGTTLEPPKHAQSVYPNGGVLCSPTSTSMLLGYWAGQLQQPCLDQRTPDLLPQLWDKKYDGAGNWSFNMSLAGSQPGMVGYVSRLRNLRDLETWIMRGVPVATSVSYDLLKGKDKKGASDGHLVVLVGFTATGDPIFNDPGRNIVRMTYAREAFRRAWESSGRTVYLVYPRNWRLTNEGPWRPSPRF